VQNFQRLVRSKRLLRIDPVDARKQQRGQVAALGDRIERVARLNGIGLIQIALRCGLGRSCLS
jgi:hypothetical protein